MSQSMWTVPEKFSNNQAKATIWDAPLFFCNILSSGMPTPNPISASKDANHSSRTMSSNKTFPGP